MFTEAKHAQRPHLSWLNLISPWQSKVPTYSYKCHRPMQSCLYNLKDISLRYLLICVLSILFPYLLISFIFMFFDRYKIITYQCIRRHIFERRSISILKQDNIIDFRMRQAKKFLAKQPGEDSIIKKLLKIVLLD